MGLLKVNFDQVEMFGYVSGETDFQAAFTRASADIPGFATAFENNVLTPLVDAVQGNNVGGFILILGLADRVDTPGLSREQIRQQEHAAALGRANSATDGVFALLNDRVGGVLGDGWPSVDNIAERRESLGACILAESGPNLSEAQRQRNRRVLFAVTQYI